MKPGRLGKSNEQYWIWITNENAVGWVISRTQLGSPKSHHIAHTTWASTMDSLGRKAADRPAVVGCWRRCVLVPEIRHTFGTQSGGWTVDLAT